MTERDKILGRIREALTVPAPRPGQHGAGAHHPTLPSPSPSRRAGEWLPPVGATFEAQLAAFSANAKDLKAALELPRNVEELGSMLMRLRDAEGWKKMASHGGALTDAACLALGLTVCRTDQPYDATELEGCDVGITECDALVAQTGSVLVTTRSAGGRALSVLPPHHVVLARRDQLVRDLPAAFQLLQQKYAPDFPSMISFVTGPSRTGDIERILVLGAHGPKKLTIFCL